MQKERAFFIYFLLFLLLFKGGLTNKEDDDDTSCPKLKPPMDNLTQEVFINQLTDACRYDKLVKPVSDQPVNVWVQLDLSHMESSDQVQFKAHMLVQYRYYDTRLNYTTLSPKRGNIYGENLLRKKIWLPHLFIRNEKSTVIMGMDSKDILVSINPQGEIIYSFRVTANFYCWMNLKKFPFDTQDCDLRWNSWTYNASELQLFWDTDRVKVEPNLHLTEFILTESWTEESEVQSAFSKGALEGNFSELIFRFRLKREVGYYIMDYFLPSILLVCTSWVTFWLQADASPARTALGTSTMLAFITLNGGLSKNLPKVSYIKASEIWFLACACFIFSSMAEFAFVNVIWRRRKEVELKKQSSKHILFGAITPSLARKQIRKIDSIGSLYKPQSCSSLTDFNNLTVQTTAFQRTKHSSKDDGIGSEESITIPESPPQLPPIQKMSPHDVSNWIDRKSRICFPIAFLIFNIFYWSFVYIL